MPARLIPYRTGLTARARALRQDMPPAERRLWRKLRGRKMCGDAFVRQRPLAGFLVDFYCKELRLAIEVDGWTHSLKAAADAARQAALEALGVRFLRFWDREVLSDLEGVTEQIEGWIRMNTASATNAGAKASGLCGAAGDPPSSRGGTTARPAGTTTHDRPRRSPT
jgi:very-short-patch-repair endonuclease